MTGNGHHWCLDVLRSGKGQGDYITYLGQGMIEVTRGDAYRAQGRRCLVESNAGSIGGPGNRRSDITGQVSGGDGKRNDSFNIG